MRHFLERFLDVFKSTKWCPHCQSRSLELYYVDPVWGLRTNPRISPEPFLYRCDNCGVRLGHYESGKWFETSNPRYDLFYSKGSLKFQREFQRVKDEAR